MKSPTLGPSAMGGNRSAPGTPFSPSSTRRGALFLGWSFAILYGIGFVMCVLAHGGDAWSGFLLALALLFAGAPYTKEVRDVETYLAFHRAERAKQEKAARQLEAYARAINERSGW